jgi:hypothetical protein
MANAEISNVKQILGLQHGKEYSDVKSLRYGQLMIMTDQARAGMLACMRLLACACLLACSLALRACMLTWHGCAQDHDGSHIKGLLINFLHAHFPSLLKARSAPACSACMCCCAALRCVALVALTCPGILPASDPELFGGVHHAHHQGHQGQATHRVPHHARVRALRLRLLLRCCCAAVALLRVR